MTSVYIEEANVNESSGMVAIEWEFRKSRIK